MWGAQDVCHAGSVWLVVSFAATVLETVSAAQFQSAHMNADLTEVHSIGTQQHPGVRCQNVDCNLSQRSHVLVHPKVEVAMATKAQNTWRKDSQTPEDMTPQNTSSPQIDPTHEMPYATHYVEWSLCNSSFHSNLGGQGPDRGEHSIRYFHAGTAQDPNGDSQNLDLVIKAVSPYAAENPAFNGLRKIDGKSKCLGQINVKAGTHVDLTFSLHLAGTRKPFTQIPPFFMIHYLDGTPSSPAAVTFYENASILYTSDNSLLTLSGKPDDKSLTFTDHGFHNNLALRQPATETVEEENPDPNRGVISEVDPGVSFQLTYTAEEGNESRNFSFDSDSNREDLGDNFDRVDPDESNGTIDDPVQSNGTNVDPAESNLTIDDPGESNGTIDDPAQSNGADEVPVERNGSNGTIDDPAQSSGADEVPVERNGTADCVTTDCVIWGDPHIITFQRTEQHRELYGNREVYYRTHEWRHNQLSVQKHGTFWLVKNDRVQIQGRYAGNPSGVVNATSLVGLAIGGPFLNGNKMVIRTLRGNVTWNLEHILDAVPSEFNNGMVHAKANDLIPRVTTGEIGRGFHGFEARLPDGIILTVNRWEYSLDAKISVCQSEAAGTSGQCGRLIPEHGEYEMLAVPSHHDWLMRQRLTNEDIIFPGRRTNHDIPAKLCDDCVVWKGVGAVIFQHNDLYRDREVNNRTQESEQDRLRVQEHGTFWLVKNDQVQIQGRYAGNPGGAVNATFLVGLAIGGPFLNGNKMVIRTLQGNVAWNLEHILDAVPSELNNGMVHAKANDLIPRVTTGEIGRGFRGFEARLPEGITLTVNRWKHCLDAKISACRAPAAGNSSQCGRLISERGQNQMLPVSSQDDWFMSQSLSQKEILLPARRTSDAIAAKFCNGCEVDGRPTREITAQLPMAEGKLENTSAEVHAVQIQSQTDASSEEVASTTSPMPVIKRSRRRLRVLLPHEEQEIAQHLPEEEETVTDASLKGVANASSPIPVTTRAGRVLRAKLPPQTKEVAKLAQRMLAEEQTVPNSPRNVSSKQVANTSSPIPVRARTGRVLRAKLPPQTKEVAKLAQRMLAEEQTVRWKPTDASRAHGAT